MRYIFLGPPGSGKGTQAKQWVRSHEAVRHLSTGDMLRAAISAGTPMGIEAKRFMDRGELVPDETVIGLIREVISKEQINEMIFDGFPRTLPQAQALDRLLEEEEMPLDGAILFDMDSAALIERLSGRRTCSKCGEMYHVKHNPPPSNGVCRSCGGGPIIQRPDDQEAVIRKRLEVYQSQTEPLVAFYKGTGRLVRIDASQTPEQVFSTLHGIIEGAESSKN